MPPWTAPRTWVALEKPPAATWNTHLRDNMLALRWGPWMSFEEANIEYGTNIADYGSPFGIGQARMSGDGRECEIRAVLKAFATITAGVTVVQLPSGWRPTAQLMFQLAGDTSNQHTVRTDMGTSGNINCPSENLGNGSALSLCGLRWAVA